jgi:AraC-like DNA-binding protein
MDAGRDDFSRVFGRFFDAFEAQGLPRERLWASLESETAAAGYSTWTELVSAGPRAVGDVWARMYAKLPPFFALLAATKVPMGAYAIVDYLSASCPDMEAGMGQLARYFHLIRPGVTFNIQARGQEAEVEFVDALRADTFFDEWMIGVTISRFRAAMGLNFPLLRASFRTPSAAGADGGGVRGFLGCEPSLGAKNASFVVGIEDWKRPFLLRDDRMRESLEAHAERLSREHADDPSELRRRLRDAIVAELRGGDPATQTVAKRLGVSVRTLQRKLAEEGLSFQTVVDETRAELADRYLETEGLSVTEVAFLLGYAESSSFARAYKRWRGRTPVESRRQSRVGA